MRARLVVFDLDDTLYLERTYVQSGFREVASKVASAGVSPEKVYAYLWRRFGRGIRRNSFDSLLQRWPEIASSFGVADLVDVYRNHAPNVRPMLGALATLKALGDAGAVLAIISDGLLPVQETKLRALGVRELFHEIVFTDQRGREFWKPHPWSFHYLGQKFAVPPTGSVYVADNPAKDFIAPNLLGWETIRLRCRGQLHQAVEAATPEASPRREVEGLSEVIDLL